jgi:molecular chaperone GrpE (heat shock protein)
MKIRIDIDLQPSKTEELDRLARLIKSIEAIINALESEIENYRRRLERIEEMTTRFESNHEEN